VKAQLTRYGRGFRPALLFPTGSSIILEVSLIGDYFELLNYGQAFARLNKSFCNEARRLADFGVGFRAYVQKNSWEACCAALNNSQPEPSATTFAVDVDVYSFRHHADRIGDIFSQVGFFLQCPNHDFAEALYYNPQILEIKGFEEKQETSANFTSEAAPELAEAGISISSDCAEPEPQRDGSDLVDSILNSLSHNGILHEIHTDQNRIKTKLLPYANIIQVI
jgi:SWI/SNF-related matrix-associated actin-dependent regulator of chromatin subfamily A3